MYNLLSRLWSRCRRREGRLLRLLGICMLLLVTLYVLDAQKTVPAASIVVDLELTEEMQEFVRRNEDQGSFFQQISNAPRTNPGIVIVYDTATSSQRSSSTPTDTPNQKNDVSSAEMQSSASTRVRSLATHTGSGSLSQRIRTYRTLKKDERSAQASTSVNNRKRPTREIRKAVTMRLIRDDGIVLFPRYHFGSGSTQMILDERRFRPGFYTLEAESTNVHTGAREAVSQDFAWGVLAMNTDKDRYYTGEIGEVQIGALDSRGEIVCDADLTLAITDPTGKSIIFRTSNRTIEITGTCGVKKGGLLSPDYRTAYPFEKEGTYTLKLESVMSGHTATIYSTITVRASHPMLIHRKAATRLWPFAPSTMNITVEFSKAFSGRIRETVPRGFILTHSQPEALIQSDPASGDLTLLWQGTWNAGTQAHLSYTYDAPDISPEFYLLGPLVFNTWTESGSRVSLQETRSWQIANDSASTSENYDIVKDTLASGGGELAFSSNYRLSDTIGEPGTGIISSTNYRLKGGYRSTDENFASLDCWTTLNLGTILGTGQATGEANCTVITDSSTGYTLSWQVTTGSGGTATGYMINQFEDTILPFSPAVANTPETWSVSASAAEWGGRLRSSSTDSDAQWGTDGVSEKWLNVGSGSSVNIVSRSSRTATAGSIEQLQFRSEVGSTRVQPNGTYEVNVDFYLSAP